MPTTEGSAAAPRTRHAGYRNQVIKPLIKQLAQDKDIFIIRSNSLVGAHECTANRNGTALMVNLNQMFESEAAALGGAGAQCTGTAVLIEPLTREIAMR